MDAKKQISFIGTLIALSGAAAMIFAFFSGMKGYVRGYDNILFQVIAPFVIGLVLIEISKNLRLYKKNARIITITLSIIGILHALIWTFYAGGLILILIEIVLNIWILSVLLNKEVVNLFNQK